MHFELQMVSNVSVSQQQLPERVTLSRECRGTNVPRVAIGSKFFVSALRFDISYFYSMTIVCTKKNMFPILEQTELT